MYFAVGSVGILLLPTSNLLILIGSNMAERFLYLPAAGFAMAIASLAFRLRRPKAPQTVLAALLVLYAGRTYALNFGWHDNLSLHRRT
jgi:hypothetical protein